MLKIFLIQDALINAGAEKSHLEILSKFSNRTKAEVVYFYPRHDLKDAFEKANIVLHFIHLNGKYSFATGIFRLIKLIRKENPDLLVSCLYRANIMSRISSWVTGVPLVGTLVSDSYGAAKLEEKERGLWKFKLFWWLDRVTSFIPVHWIANSRSIAIAHERTLGLKGELISVVYRGRSVDGINAWNIHPGSNANFVSVGRLNKGKGFEELIRAFAEIKSTYPDARLTIYGEGHYRAALVKLIDELAIHNSVNLPGNIANVVHKLIEHDCFVFPSWYEGFSGALVEAMMSGIPIIASDIPMNLEAITPSKNALVFEVKNIQDLITKMKYAIEHPGEMKNLGKKARDEAFERFDINLIACQYEEVLHRVHIREHVKNGKA